MIVCPRFDLATRQAPRGVVGRVLKRPVEIARALVGVALAGRGFERPLSVSCFDKYLDMRRFLLGRGILKSVKLGA